MRMPALLAVLAIALAGCATAMEGNRSSSVGPEFDSRPRDLRINDVDPCALLTVPQTVQLGVGAGTPETSQDGSARPVCQWFRFPDEPQDFYQAALGTDRGAQYAFGSGTGYRLVDITGFPAVESQQADLPLDRHCFVVLDVSDGQNITLLYSYDGSTVPMTRELACEKAAVAAEMVLSTLDELVGG